MDSVILIEFKDNFDDTHVERVFRMNKNGDDLSGLLKQLIAATAQDSSDLKDWYDSLLNKDSLAVSTLIGRDCTIETEYRGEYVNVKTIKCNGRDNGGSFFQSTEADSPRKEGAVDPGQPKRYITVSDEAASFF